MGASVETQLIAELEAALEQQQTAVNEGHAAIRDTIRELHQALSELEEREQNLTQASADLGGRAVTQLGAVRDAVSKNQAPAEELELAREKIAELEREALTRQALKEQLAESESARAHLQRQLEEQALAIAEAEKTQRRLRKIEQVYKEASDALQAGQAARRRVAELEATVAEYKQAAHAEHEKSSQIQEILDTVRKSEAQLREELDGFKNQDILSSLDRLRAAESELIAAGQHVTELSHELEITRNKVERLERDTRELDEELSAQASEAEKWKACAENLEAQSGQLTLDLDSLRQRARDTAESERAQRVAVEKAEAELEVLRQETALISELQAQIERLESESRQLADRLHHTEDELADERAKGTKSQLAAQLAEALRDREAVREELRNVRRRPMSDFVDHELAGAPDHSRRTIEEELPEDMDNADDADEVADDLVLNVPTDDAKRMLGEIFLKAGIISEPQLGEALSTQKKERPWRHLGSVLVSMGHAEEAQVAKAIAHQRGLEYLSLGKNAVNPEAARLISARLAEKHLCIPVREENGELILAMENPLDLIAIEDVERASERRVRPAVSTPAAIVAAIAKAYTTERQRA